MNFRLPHRPPHQYNPSSERSSVHPRSQPPTLHALGTLLGKEANTPRQPSEADTQPPYLRRDETGEGVRRLSVDRTFFSASLASCRHRPVPPGRPSQFDALTRLPAPHTLARQLSCVPALRCAHAILEIRGQGGMPPPILGHARHVCVAPRLPGVCADSTVPGTPSLRPPLPLPAFVLHGGKYTMATPRRLFSTSSPPLSPLAPATPPAANTRRNRSA